jgi:hypothetical protein
MSIGSTRGSVDERASNDRTSFAASGDAVGRAPVVSNVEARDFDDFWGADPPPLIEVIAIVVGID